MSTLVLLSKACFIKLLAFLHFTFEHINRNRHFCVPFFTLKFLWTNSSCLVGIVLHLVVKMVRVAYTSVMKALCKDIFLRRQQNWDSEYCPSFYTSFPGTVVLWRMEPLFGDSYCDPSDGHVIMRHIPHMSDVKDVRWVREFSSSWVLIWQSNSTCPHEEWLFASCSWSINDEFTTQGSIHFWRPHVFLTAAEEEALKQVQAVLFSLCLWGWVLQSIAKYHYTNAQWNFSLFFLYLYFSVFFWVDVHAWKFLEVLTLFLQMGAFLEKQGI